METGILLESGTNELEILEFKVEGKNYGINVAKIREILPYKKPTPIPNSHPFIEGVFMPRDFLISVVDLTNSLNLIKTDHKKSMLIVTYFNNVNIAFHVDSVVGIHRVTWAEIIKPDEVTDPTSNQIATGIVTIDENTIAILDFERIIAEINAETSLKVSDIEHLGLRARNSSPIMIVEDSQLLSELLHDCLVKAGYSNIISKTNGQEAWDYLKELKVSGKFKESVTCVITDIEMPQMDGHRLTKLIKDDKEMSYLPVIIFSSIVNEDMRKKGELLGANGQISKPEIGSLVDIIDEFILK